MKNNTKDAYVEVLSIIDLLEENQRSKIPKKLKDFFEKNKNQNYQANIVPDIPLEEQDLLQETIDILAMLKLNYWCTNEEKEELLDLLNENEKKYQEQLLEKYNPDNLFKRREETKVVLSEEESLIEYKKYTLFDKIKIFIKNIFRKK